jgi:hypothetical protein
MSSKTFARLNFDEIDAVTNLSVFVIPRAQRKRLHWLE